MKTKIREPADRHFIKNAKEIFAKRHGLVSTLVLIERIGVCNDENLGSRKICQYRPSL